MRGSWEIKIARYLMVGATALAIILLVWVQATPVVPLLPITTIRFVSPTNGQAISGTVALACVVQGGEGTFPGAYVQYSLDGTLLASKLLPPYSFYLNTALLTNEPHSLTARVFDSAGHELASVTNTVYVDNAARKEEIDREIIQAANGVVAFVPPRKMTVSSSYVIEVRVAKRFQERLLQDLNTNDLNTTESNDLGLREHATPIKVGDIMVARLVGAGFKIDAITPEMQIIPNGEYTRWTWSVTPQLSGTRALHLSLCIVIRSKRSGMPDGQLLYALPIEYRSIDVHASILEQVRQFAAQNVWLTILGACVATLANLGLWSYELWLKKNNRGRSM